MQISSMELQESSMHTSSAAVRRSFIEELLPLLRKIHGLRHRASSYSLAKREKAKLVRLAADVCLVKAAGGNAKWGEALRRTLVSKNVQYTSACAGMGDHCINGPPLKNVQYTSPCAGMADHCINVDNTEANGDGDYQAQISVEGRHVKKEISTLKAMRSYCKYRPHVLQTTRCAAARSPASRMRPLHVRKWFKRCRNACSRPQNAVMAAKVVTAAHNRPICKTYAEPAISAGACNDNMSRQIEDYNAHNVPGQIEDYKAHNIDSMAGQIEDLQRLIPGGSSLMDPASLFEETALYILALQMQVHSLSALALIAKPTHTSIP